MIRRRNKKRDRGHRFEVRLTAKERRSLRALAGAEGISDSAWVQRQIWRSMNALIEKNEKAAQRERDLRE